MLIEEFWALIDAPSSGENIKLISRIFRISRQTHWNKKCTIKFKMSIPKEGENSKLWDDTTRSNGPTNFAFIYKFWWAYRKVYEAIHWGVAYICPICEIFTKYTLMICTNFSICICQLKLLVKGFSFCF